MKSFIEKNQKIFLILFLVMELAGYLLFMIINIASPFTDIDYVKYGLLILCLCYALLVPCKLKEKIFLGSAMVFTLISDYFLLLREEYYEFALSTFIIAQILHGLRICYIDEKLSLRFILERVIIITFVIIFAEIFIQEERIIVGLISVYFPLLVCNAVDSLLLFLKKKMDIRLFIGFLLFILCDVCVGVYNLDMIGASDIPSFISDSACIMMWGFYLPSQVLICLSLRRADYEK